MSMLQSSQSQRAGGVKRYLKVEGEVARGRVQHQVQQRRDQLRQARPCRASRAHRLSLHERHTALSYITAVQILSNGRHQKLQQD